MGRRRSPWKRFWRWATPRLAPPLIALALRLLYRTLRITFVGLDRVLPRWERREATVFAFWHGRMLLMPAAFRAQPGHRLAVMISTHEDGDVIARTMERLGFETARGSTTRGGAAAAKACLRLLRGGADVAITPDGPRGPRWTVQDGAVELARLSGMPLVAVSYGAAPAKIFSSWDRFMLPAPFARAAVVYGEPIRVARDATPEALREARARLERELRRITDEADALVARRSAPAAASRARLEG